MSKLRPHDYLTFFESFDSKLESILESLVDDALMFVHKSWSTKSRYYSFDAIDGKIRVSDHSKKIKRHCGEEVDMNCIFESVDDMLDKVERAYSVDLSECRMLVAKAMESKENSKKAAQKAVETKQANADKAWFDAIAFLKSDKAISFLQDNDLLTKKGALKQNRNKIFARALKDKFNKIMLRDADYIYHKVNCDDFKVTVRE